MAHLLLEPLLLSLFPLRPVHTFQTLIRRLDAATRGPADELRVRLCDALAEAAADRSWLAQTCREPAHDTYRRHVLHADPAGAYTLLSIAWGGGHRSPIHAHHTWCCLALYEGELVETAFAPADDGECGLVVGSTRCTAAQPSFDTAGGGIHQIANGTGERAVSLHVYGVSPDQLTTGVNRILPKRSLT